GPAPVAGGPAHPLGLPAPLLGLDARVDRGAGRPGRPPGWGRRLDRLGDQGGEAFLRRAPVLQLGAVFGGGHRQHTVDEPAAQPPRTRPPGRCPAGAFSASGGAALASRFQRSSTRESAVLTDCPPGPPERENRQVSSPGGIVIDRVTRSPAGSVMCTSMPE